MIYDIAGLRIDIKNRCKYTDMLCKEYVSKDQTSPAEVTAFVTNEEFYEEKKSSPNFPDGYIENICLHRCICRQLPMKNRMLLHAAVLDYNGEGYAFLGRSGTGKSTHTGLWLKYLQGAKIVNGDKPILQEENGEFIAYGTPWMGKEGLGENGKTVLKGLCFLEQAKENSITRLTAAEAANRIFVQILFPEDEENVARTLELTDQLVTNTPCYLLKCTISEEAVALAYQALSGKEYKSK